MTKISIITVNLNNSEGLQKTIESVVGQTYTNKEYFIIDGGSIDGSIEVINEYATEINYWVSEPDNGIYEAMNKGIDASKGEWIIFMNSGDKFFDNKTLEVIFNDKQYENIDVIYGNTLYKDTGKILIPPDKITKSYFFNNTLCHQSIFTNREAFKKARKYNLQYIYIADREWLLHAKILNLNFQFINETISEWDPEGFCKNNPLALSSEVKLMKNTHFRIYEIFILYSLKKISGILRKLFTKYLKNL